MTDWRRFARRPGFERGSAPLDRDAGPNGTRFAARVQTANLRRWAAGCLTVLCLAGLAGCSMLFPSGDKVKWDDLTLAASDEANNDSPIAVDVVFVTDKTLLARIAELPASKWFAVRGDLKGTFPDAIRYQSWELVPGQRVVVPGDTLRGPRVAGVFVFADYPGPGAHRVRVDRFDGRLVVQLGDNAFSISSVK
jgi:type VI secretion system protein